MAKKKKKLSEIKDALMSSTSFIKNSEPPVEKNVAGHNAVEIDKSVYRKIKLLANYYEKDPVELINDAIAHFLKLKKLDIDEALKNIVVGSDDDE